MTVREVETEAAAQVPGAVTSGPVTLSGTHQVEITFAHPDVQQRVLPALPEIAGSLQLILILGLLLRMARTLREGDVFVPANARRLHTAAAAIVAMGVLGPLADAVTTSLLIGDAVVDSVVPFTYTLSAEPILLALLVAALAEVFRRGARLREDTEGLV